jgi:hypothetical protein
MNNWLIGGPIIAAVVACWGYIQEWLSKIRSLFLITVTVDSCLSNAVAFFCWKNMKRVKIGDYKYTSFHNFVRPLERYQHVAYECISQTGTLFFYGWVPLIIGAKSNNKDAPASSRRDQGDFSFTFFRRTLDVDEFMLSAIDLYNKYMLSGFSEKRFYIGREFGTFGMRHDNKDENAPTPDAPRSHDVFDMWHLRILRWTPDQIGATIHESGKPFEFLAFPDNVWEAITDIEHWLKSEEWYKEKGIPWKRGWLLYGPPGTGKTSLVRSIGEYLDIPIVSFSLSTFSDREFQYN